MASEHSEELGDMEGEQGEEDKDTPRKRARKKFHFSIELDNHLIRTVMEENPYATTGKDTLAAWEAVARKMDEAAGTTDLLPRTCRDRLERLLVYVETESPLLKAPAEFDRDNQERMELLEQMVQIRKESAKKTGQPVVPLRLKPRLVSPVKSGGKAARRSQRTTPYIMPARAPGEQIPVVFSFGGEGGGGADAEAKAAAMAISEMNTHAGEDGQQEGVGQSSTGLRTYQLIHSSDNSSSRFMNGTLDSHERSLLTELLHQRRLDDELRKEELEVRRQEAEVQKMKLELEGRQWEAEQKERETRLALEGEERKIVLQFMRKTLLPNGIPAELPH